MDRQGDWHRWNELQQRTARHAERDEKELAETTNPFMRRALEQSAKLNRWIEEQARRGKYGDVD